MVFKTVVGSAYSAVRTDYFSFLKG